MNKIARKISEYHKAKEHDLTLGQFINRFNHCISDRLLRRRLLKICGQNYSMVEAAHSAYVANEFRQRYALQLAAEPSHDNNWTKAEFPKVIWWCWLQGEDQAPRVTKTGLASLHRNLPDYDIRVLTWDNIKDYVDLPKVIYDKFAAGWISGAFFSDILRLALLSKYGGFWIDSTVYCSDDRLVRAIEKKNMFMYQNLMTVNSRTIKMSSWFIASKKNNPYLTEVSQLLTEYCVNSNFTEDYFVCHLLLTLFAEKYADIWNDMDIYNNTDPHILQYMMNKSYDEEMFNRIMAKSSFHKLNHHLELVDGDTFYHHLEELN